MNVIFDIGNVVLDWDTDKIIGSTDLPDAQKIELNNELFSHQDWLDLDSGLAAESTVIEKVCRRSSLEPEAVVRALDIAKKSLTPIPESILLINEFEDYGLPLYCLSNMSIETYEFLKPKNDFFEIFDGIVISGIEKMMKPNRKIFELTLSRHSLEPSETLFIDDSEANIEAAKELGLNTHLFKRTDKCYASLRDLLL